MQKSTETEGPQSFKPETKEPESVVPPDFPAAKGVMLPLGNNRFLVYNKFKGTNRVHIRQYERKNGFLLASKVGVCMAPKRFASLRFRLPQIEERVKQQREGEMVGDNLKVHIGGPLYVTVSQGYACVNFRKFFFPTGETEPKPSKHGIALRFGEFEQLLARIEELIELKPELAQVELCSSGTDHLNQEGYFSCLECNFCPSGFNPFAGY